MKDLFLLRGLPGSGKSTIAKLMSSIAGFHALVGHYAADMYFEDEDGNYNFDASKLGKAHRACEDKCREFMENDYDLIIIHNTFTRMKEMNTYRSLATQFDYRVHVLTVENHHGSGNIHGVPDVKIREMAGRYNIKLNVPERPFIAELIDKMYDTPQSPTYHPEGNVGVHTALVTGYLLTHYPDNEPLHWAGLFHDTGKIDTTKYNEDKEVYTAYGHEKISVLYFNEWSTDIARIMDYGINTIKTRWIIENHMRYKQMDRMRESKQEELRSSPWFSDLIIFGEADNMVKMFEETTVEERQKYLDNYSEWIQHHNIK